MKLFLLCIVVFLSATTFSQTKIDTLQNETIIRLSKSKLSESVITQKINQSICNFDISVYALIKLKENNVNDNVINLMVEVQSESNTPKTSAIKNNSNEKDINFSESGIYFFKNQSYTPLDPIVVSTTAPLGFGTLYRSKIVGESANYQLENKRPEFYFNFETVKRSINDINSSNTSTNQDDYFSQIFNNNGYVYNSNTTQAISPNDFKLVRLEKKKNKTRTFVSGRVEYNQIDMSPDSKTIVNFKYEKLTANTFKISFDKDLESGEYCFVYLSNNKAANKYCYEQDNMKVFDFGIK